jgi:hypothetical protein
MPQRDVELHILTLLLQLSIHPDLKEPAQQQQGRTVPANSSTKQSDALLRAACRQGG